MKANLIIATTLFVFFACLACPSNAATTTGTTTGTFTGFTMDFVGITGGSTPDDTGYGAVAHDYRMGVHEVSRAMIDAYNANSGGPDIWMSDMTLYGGNGPNKPATGVSWNEAARFVNWLNVSTGHSPAYNYDSGSILGNDNITLWSAGDAGYDPSNPFRNSNAFYFLPSQNEWYRAAYYDPNAGVYWDYPTGSDTVPDGIDFGGDTTFDAVFLEASVEDRLYDITNVGVLSPFGTMGQGGNAWEWVEAARFPPNDSAGEKRVIRGGASGGAVNFLQSSSRLLDYYPWEDRSSIGFRIASVPEPTTATLAALGLLGLVCRRRRG